MEYYFCKHLQAQALARHIGYVISVAVITI